MASTDLKTLTSGILGGVLIMLSNYDI